MESPWMGGASYIFDTTKVTLLQLNFSNKLLLTLSTEWNYFLSLYTMHMLSKIWVQRLAE